MKLADMTFKKSREVKAQLAPLIEKVLSNPETADLFDTAYAPENNKKGLGRSTGASMKLHTHLIDEHYDTLCSILSVMNDIPVGDIEEMTRGDVNKLIFDFLRDQDLVSFFMSAEGLERVGQSVISQNALMKQTKQ